MVFTDAHPDSLRRNSSIFCASAVDKLYIIIYRACIRGSRRTRQDGQR